MAGKTAVRASRNPVKTRADLPKARRIVVKIGSSSLTTVDGGINLDAVHNLVSTLAAVRQRGTEVILVSSGAISAGLAPLNLERRPKDLATQQAAAAVGQGLLLAHYTREFAVYNYPVGQVLLTVDDLMRRSTYTNAMRALNRLLKLGVLPIVNENDAVATHEIRFGDNDRLAALVANVVKADALVMLSDVDALYDGPPADGAQRIPLVESEDDLAGVKLGSAGKAGVGTGGMVTKVEAAKIASGSGIPAALTNADNARAILSGEDVGTWFAVQGRRRRARSTWLAHLASSHGKLVLDDGAVTAVVDNHRSLLPAGLVRVEGRFESGDPVELVDLQGKVIARGLVNYSAKELPAMLGKSTLKLRAELGPEYERVVVHTDDLVLV
ncbi:glutamate 5-kinase [Micrococcoides hystricis]|uniref:Glutamate 5-kinase n=1 Tax=Micrococcoides hystricis TaxID=1572761 RepID=A0ABV6P9V3_9MICC